MACCVVAAFVIGVLRACWFRLPGVPAPVEVGFAPVARRPAPGTAVATSGPVVRAPAPANRPRGRALPPVAVGLVFLALGTVTYALAVQALVIDGWVEPRADGAVWWVRTAALLVFVLVCAGLAATRLERRRPGAPRAVRAAMLWGTGAAWWLWGIVDMHGFGLFEAGGGTLVADVLFHGPGAVLMTAALVITTRNETDSNRKQGSGSHTSMRKELVHMGVES